MSYQWPLDPQVLFAERYPQMAKMGLPVEDVDALRGRIVEMWREGSGGWVKEWSDLAGRYSSDGRHDLAALAYGWAKFPAIADEPKRIALQRQVESYELAVAEDLPVAFERRVLRVPFGASETDVPVHLFSAAEELTDAPVVLASGGVDTWKIDLHATWVEIALRTGATVLAFDIPGTGETEAAFSMASTELIDGIAAAARALGDGRVFHLGISMGGYFSAYSGLRGVVDASVVCGGPVEATFAPGKNWEAGMADIIGNVLGFDHSPDQAELDERLGALSLRPLFDEDSMTPMFVINGVEDIHVPQHDTLVFRGRRNTEVEMMEGTGHCAVSKWDEMLEKVLAWLSGQISSEGHPLPAAPLA